MNFGSFKSFYFSTFWASFNIIFYFFRISWPILGNSFLGLDMNSSGLGSDFSKNKEVWCLFRAPQYCLCFLFDIDVVCFCCR